MAYFDDETTDWKMSPPSRNPDDVAVAALAEAVEDEDGDEDDDDEGEEEGGRESGCQRPH